MQVFSRKIKTIQTFQSLNVINNK